MRDALLVGGDISLATKDTLATGANTIDLGTISSLAGKSLHQSGLVGDPLMAVFMNTAALASGDYFYGVVSDCDTVGGTYVPIAQTAPSAAACAAGTKQVCQIPVQHREFLRLDAMPKSSGSFTAKTVTAWIENAPNYSDGR